MAVAAVDADKYNDLGQKYGVTGFPTLKVFAAHATEPEPYAGGRDLASLVLYLNEKAGTDLAADGGLIEGGGVVHELRDKLQSFVNTESEEERLDLMSQCAKTADGLGGASKHNFVYYERVLKRIMEQGLAFIGTERKRLTGVLAGSDSLQPHTRRNFERRINVLKQFDEL